MEAYLDNNRIIFKNYIDFYDIFDSFLEGIFLSYAMREKQDCRLHHFDDYLLLRILYYAEPDRFMKYLKRYDIRGIIYKPVNQQDERVDAIILAFFGQLTDFLKEGLQKIEQNGFYFRQRLESLINNGLNLLALVNFDSGIYVILGKQLLSLISNEQFASRAKAAFISNVIRNKGEYFDVSDLQEMQRVCLNTPKLHDQHIFQSFYYLQKKKQVDLTIGGNDEYGIIVQAFYEGNQQDKNIHYPDILFYCFYHLSAELKSRLRERIEKDLSTHFVSHDYNFFAVLEIIDYKKFFRQYLDSFPLMKQPDDDRHFFPIKPVAYRDLNDLLNLCFCFQIDTTHEDFQKLKGISDYYDWLLDMEHFDYAAFKPEWILEFQTTPYLKKIFSFRQVREHVKSYLGKYRHPKLIELFVQFGTDQGGEIEKETVDRWEFDE